jgi:hypothetical protein
MRVPPRTPIRNKDPSLHKREKNYKWTLLKCQTSHQQANGEKVDPKAKTAPDEKTFNKEVELSNTEVCEATTRQHETEDKTEESHNRDHVQANMNVSGKSIHNPYKVTWKGKQTQGT